MPPQDDKVNELLKTLDQLQERMLKTGYIAGYGQFENRTGTNLTIKGQLAVDAVGSLDEAIGPLAPKEIVALWKFLVELQKQRVKSSEGENN